MRNIERNNFDEYVEDETTRFAEKKNLELIIIFQGLHIVIQSLVIISKQKKTFKNNIMSKKKGKLYRKFAISLWRRLHNGGIISLPKQINCYKNIWQFCK